MNPFFYWDQFIRGRKPSDETKGYRLIEYRAVSSPNVSADDLNLEKYIDCDGDHLSIHSIHGAAPVYVRLGHDSNPFIRVRENMVLTRPFRSVTFRLGNKRAPEAGRGRIAAVVWAYASHGPLIQFPPKEYGFRRNALTRYGLTATTATTALEAFIFDGISGPTMGRLGGTLVIKNTDAANTLYLVGVLANSTALAVGSHGFPIGPGESLALQLEQAQHSDVTLLADNGNLSVKTLAGTCSFALLGSSVELDDCFGTQAEHLPSMR